MLEARTHSIAIGGQQPATGCRLLHGVVCVLARRELPHRIPAVSLHVVATCSECPSWSGTTSLKPPAAMIRRSRSNSQHGGAVGPRDERLVPEDPGPHRPTALPIPGAAAATRSIPANPQRLQRACSGSLHGSPRRSPGGWSGDVRGLKPPATIPRSHRAPASRRVCRRAATQSVACFPPHHAPETSARRPCAGARQAIVLDRRARRSR